MASLTIADKIATTSPSALAVPGDSTDRYMLQKCLDADLPIKPAQLSVIERFQPICSRKISFRHYKRLRLSIRAKRFCILQYRRRQPRPRIRLLAEGREAFRMQCFTIACTCFASAEDSPQMQTLVRKLVHPRHAAWLRCLKKKSQMLRCLSNN